MTDPGLVRTLLLRTNISIITMSEPKWRENITNLLSEKGIVQLKANRNNEALLRASIIDIIARPVDVAYLQFFPVVEQINRGESDTRVTFSLREQI